MRKLINDWRIFLAEKRVDPVYKQETFNAYMLLAFSNERGGNRDQIKNDIRAIEEVLTVTTVEPTSGGIQKDMGDFFLSTIKLRVRLPGGIDKFKLAQEIVSEINAMRGIGVRNHRVERAEELREDEMNYSGVLPKDPAKHKEYKTRLLKHGAQPNTPPYDEKPSYEKPPTTSESQSEESKE